MNEGMNVYAAAKAPVRCLQPLEGALKGLGIGKPGRQALPSRQACNERWATQRAPKQSAIAVQCESMAPLHRAGAKESAPPHMATDWPSRGLRLSGRSRRQGAKQRRKRKGVRGRGKRERRKGGGGDSRR